MTRFALISVIGQFCLLYPRGVSTACSIYIQSTNIKYLDASQLTLFNITDPCTITCADGYYGDFCQDLSQYSNLPAGPWNQAGYCVAGAATLRSMSIDVSALSSVQYTKKDSVLIGISNAGSRSSSVVSEVSLYSRVITPVLYNSPAGSLNAVLVRKGVVYVARTYRVLGVDSYDIAVLAAPMQPQRLMPTAMSAILFEVCVDKGAVVSYVYSPSKISACYPNGVCVTWLPSIATASGMVVAADCLKSVYVSSLSSILKVTKDGATTLKTTPSTIYCMTGIPEVNVLLYKLKSDMWQINLGTGATTSLPLGVTQTQEMMCSTDVSEQSNQILIVQNGVVSTLEAVQAPCPYGTTSTRLLCNSTAQCTPCPSPPPGAYTIEGSVSCEWRCRVGYDKIGSKCVAPTLLPCPAYFRISAVSSGLCTPSVMPWADQGKYAVSTSYSSQQLFPSASSPVYTLASSGGALIHAVTGQFYISFSNGASWAVLSVTPYSAVSCYYSSQNGYYYLSSRRGILWTAFTTQRAEGTQHCLWALNASNAVASNGPLTVVQAWALDGKLCSATGEGGGVTGVTGVYAILCGYNYVSYAAMTPNSALSPAVGGPVPGYSDGVFLAARFNAPSSLVADYSSGESRLYIADTGNCVIREVDLARGVVVTVAGSIAGSSAGSIAGSSAGSSCQRVDGALADAALVYPTNLVYTPYDGFFLFTDRFPNEQAATVRQFHAPTSRVDTIAASPFVFSQVSGIAASGSAVLVISQRMYYVYSTASALCPAGSSAWAGGAYSADDCLPCPAFHYSDASGACRPCSTPVCGLPGQLLIPCQLGADAYCGACTNKPAGSKYTGPSSVPGVGLQAGDCAWVYTPPCPVGYYNSSYNSSGVCANCPAWSTTAKSGSKSLSDCACVGGGGWVNGACVLPSPFTSMPSTCSPLAVCTYAEPAFPFPIMPACTSFDVDSVAGVCPCQPGEYIRQIYPKVCAACPAGLYSPSGRGCRPCPYLTEPSTDMTSCRCTAGTYDVSFSSTPACVCGPGKAFSAASGCGACPVNTYSQVVRGYSAVAYMQPLQCTACPAGTWSQAGATVCAPCALGYFRRTSDAACRSCDAGAYAPYPAVPLCVDCVASCGGRMEVQCPTDETLYMCLECPARRANSAFNGQRNCATSCNAGFYELDGECVGCSGYSRASCPEGNRFVECSAYTDVGCVSCVNASMPLSFASWSYRSDVPDGPSTVCEWVCNEGYSAQLPVGVDVGWECVKAGEWSVWDLFTW